MIKVEIACNSYASCLNAVKGGAHRIELFENMADGGCTPSAGIINKVAGLSIPCYVMIRPRGGDFCYSNDEIDIMLHDIAVCKKAKVAGVVFGCLKSNGEVDRDLNRMLLRAWNDGPATFHRAIDRSADLMKAAFEIADMGFERILSSGGKLNAMEGQEMLKKMQTEIGHKISIMPGAGVTAQNAKSILTYTGCKEIHATCKQTISSSAGILNPVFEETVQISDVDEIGALVRNVALMNT